MNRVVFWLSVVLLVIFASCNPPEKQAPLIGDERKLPVETMENIFYEMHLADAMVSLHMVQVTGHTSLTQYQVDSLLYEGIYEKYDCTRETFEESVLWYLQNDSKGLEDLYEKVVERFNLEIAAFEINVVDSLAAEEEKENTL